MKTEEVDVRFILHGEIKLDLFLIQLARWIDIKNEEFFYPPDTTSVNKIEMDVLTSGW